MKDCVSAPSFEVAGRSHRKARQDAELIIIPMSQSTMKDFANEQLSFGMTLAKLGSAALLKRTIELSLALPILYQVGSLAQHAVSTNRSLSYIPPWSWEAWLFCQIVAILQRHRQKALVEFLYGLLLAFMVVDPCGSACIKFSKSGKLAASPGS